MASNPAKRTIHVVDGDHGEAKVSFYPGTPSTDLESHLRKKFKVAHDCEMFLVEREDDKDEEVVISDRLPDGARFHLKLGAHGAPHGGENFKRVDENADLRIERIRALVPPACLLEEIPAESKSLETVKLGREEIGQVLAHKDDRLVVVVGPCSIHDPTAAREYAKRLLGLRNQLAQDLVVIMRVYFEKPRTTVGWKGLINDPDLDNSFQINKGLRIARLLLRDITAMGLPVGTEFLDTISPQFTSDLVSWGAIGARTTECQLHRELASGLSMPVGFKNGTGGSKQMAVDAVVAAQCPHSFLSVTTQGLSAIVETKGNGECHLILRGGSSGPNYSKEHVEESERLMEQAGVVPNVMIDCSHGNSRKQHDNQPIVCSEVGQMVAQGSSSVVGVMLESHLQAGSQKLLPGTKLVYGQSITDACIDWDTTVRVLQDLARCVRERRAKANGV